MKPNVCAFAHLPHAFHSQNATFNSLICW